MDLRAEPRGWHVTLQPWKYLSSFRREPEGRGKENWQLLLPLLMEISPRCWLWGWTEGREQESLWGGLKASFVIDSYHGLDKAWVFSKGSCIWSLISYMVMLRGATGWKVRWKGPVWASSPFEMHDACPCMHSCHDEVCHNALESSVKSVSVLHKWLTSGISLL